MYGRFMGFVYDDEGSCNGRELSPNVGGQNARWGPHFEDGGEAVVCEENSNTRST